MHISTRSLFTWSATIGIIMIHDPQNQNNLSSSTFAMIPMPVANAFSTTPFARSFHANVNSPRSQVVEQNVRNNVSRSSRCDGRAFRSEISMSTIDRPSSSSKTLPSSSRLVIEIAPNKQRPLKVKKMNTTKKTTRNVNSRNDHGNAARRRQRSIDNIDNLDNFSKKDGTSLRLTKEEEIALTQSIQDLKSVIQKRDELSATHNHLPRMPSHMYKEPQPELEPSLSFNNQPSEKEWAQHCNMSVIQLRKVLILGREARSRLVASNIGLVTQIARRYDYELRKSVQGGGHNGVGSILTLSDLIQEGNLGIMAAAERFESGKGVRFATYAGYWVKQRILRSITDHSRVIRLPAHVHTTLRAIRKARSDMEKEIGRTPSLPELAHYLEMPIEKIQLYNDSSRSVLSLELPNNKKGSAASSSNNSSSKSGTGDPDNRALIDFIASDSPTPVEDAEFDALQTDIRAVIEGLGDDRERDVIFSRFGLADGNPKTLEETGKKLGISRERVRVIENRALNKLRHPQRNHRLKDYYVDHPAVNVNSNANNSDQMAINASLEKHLNLNRGMVRNAQDDSMGINHGGINKSKTSTLRVRKNSQRNGNNIGHDFRRSRSRGRTPPNFDDGSNDTLSQSTPENIWSF